MQELTIVLTSFLAAIYIVAILATYIAEDSLPGAIYAQILEEIDDFRLFGNLFTNLVRFTAWAWIPPYALVIWIWTGIKQDLTPKD